MTLPSTATIIRVGVWGLTIANKILISCGKSALPIENNELEETISILAMVGSSAWLGWKNNSFTANAKKADEYLKKLNTDEIVPEEE